jgi:hypothetical protein
MVAEQQTPEREQSKAAAAAGASSATGDVLDAELLPLTLAELRRALQLAFPEQEAQRAAEALADAIREANESEKSAAEARARGSTGPAEVNPTSWAVSPGFFEILWCDPQLSVRMDEAMERWRVQSSEKRLRVLMALRRLPSDAEPPADLLRQVRQELGRSRAAWTRRKRAMADRMGVTRPDGSTARD